MFLASGMKKAAKNSLLDHKGSKAVLKTSDFLQVCCPNPRSGHENALNCRLQYKYQSVAHIYYLAVTTYKVDQQVKKFFSTVLNELPLPPFPLKTTKL